MMTAAAGRREIARAAEAPPEVIHLLPGIGDGRGTRALHAVRDRRGAISCAPGEDQRSGGSAAAYRAGRPVASPQNWSPWSKCHHSSE